MNSNRLFFIKRLPHAKHLATYSLMDLFVDTFNFNAHTTAVEALYMNLPVITKKLETALLLEQPVEF